MSESQRGDGGSERGENLLRAIGDERSRKILGATTESRTVEEISETCGLPKSTVYRRVRDLVDEGLLEKSIRLREDGQHTKEYRVKSAYNVAEVEVMDSLKISVTLKGDLVDSPTGKEEGEETDDETNEDGGGSSYLYNRW